MRTREITDWTRSLLKSFGGIRPEVDHVQLLKLYNQGNYTAMFKFVRDSLKLSMPLRVGYVNSGGLKDTPAWINTPTQMPTYGTKAFNQQKLTVFARKEFLDKMPFHAIVFIMAHELSHVVLNGIGHPLRNQEEAVDLTAMILGYRGFHFQDTFVRNLEFEKIKPRTWWHKLFNIYPIPKIKTSYTEHNIGYLSREEVRYAISLMK